MRETARVTSVGSKDSHAGDWLTVVPSPGLGLLLHPAEFVAALRYRVGHPVFGVDGPCPACGQPSDRLGDHALNCAWQGERIARHNSLRDRGIQIDETNAFRLYTSKQNCNDATVYVIIILS